VSGWFAKGSAYALTKAGNAVNIRTTLTRITEDSPADLPVIFSTLIDELSTSFGDIAAEFSKYLSMDAAQTTFVGWARAVGIPADKPLKLYATAMRTLSGKSVPVLEVVYDGTSMGKLLTTGTMPEKLPVPGYASANIDGNSVTMTTPWPSTVAAANESNIARAATIVGGGKGQQSSVTIPAGYELEMYLTMHARVLMPSGTLRTFSIYPAYTTNTNSTLTLVGGMKDKHTLCLTGMAATLSGHYSARWVYYNTTNAPVSLTFSVLGDFIPNPGYASTLYSRVGSASAPLVVGVPYAKLDVIPLRWAAVPSSIAWVPNAEGATPDSI
jgi:hypothetical protein